MINQKTIETLELPKILERLAKHTSFSASRQLAQELMPTNDLQEAQTWQREVTEIREIMEKYENRLNMGGIRDVRDIAIGSTRGVVIDPSGLLDIRVTLRRGETLQRTLGKMHDFPNVGNIVEEIQPCSRLQDSIQSAIDDNGEVRDSASPRLAIIRRDMQAAFDRLQTKLNRIISSKQYAQYLQEALVTTRNGRYVVPVKADFKGRVKGILHDTSSSGQTIFVEPEGTVELNNAYRDLQLQEEKEIRRILAALTEEVAQVSEDIVRTVDVLAYLDLVKAKALYAEELNANAPTLVNFQQRKKFPNHPGSVIQIEQARHPMIAGNVAVPIDVDFGDDTWSLVITGPNTGGKTVALKTVGLMILMAQSGLHLPVESAKLSVFAGVYADIGDEQSIEQSLSTFSAHMTNTIHILDVCDDQSLVLLDEVGAGTDPAEGSALARAIMNTLVNRRVTTMVTTHHPELKNYAVETDGVRNASVEFDIDTLAPTYRLIVGLPGRSNALAIAQRLGLQSEVIDDARHMVANADLDADKLLDEIHRSREEIRRKEARIAEHAADIEAERMALRERLDKVEDERRQVLIDAKRKAESEIEEFRREIKRLRKDLRTAGMPIDKLRAIQETADKLIEYSREPLDGEDAVDIPSADSESWMPRVGDAVWLDTLKAEGQVIELDREEAMVQVGTLKIRAAIRDMRRPTKTDKKIAEKELSRRRQQQTYHDPIPKAESPGLELDLRGQRVENALRKLDDYVNAAYLAGLPFGRIIHGKGTGALRKAVREMLDGHALVSKVTMAPPKEGGDGVTIIHLASIR